MRHGRGGLEVFVFPSARKRELQAAVLTTVTAAYDFGIKKVEANCGLGAVCLQGYKTRLLFKTLAYPRGMSYGLENRNTECAVQWGNRWHWSR